MVRIKLGFSKYSDNSLLLFADKVVANVSEGGKFPDIDPNISTITLARDKYRDALVAAQNGGRVEIIAKNQKRKELEKVLKLSGSYIEDHANDDEELIASTGYLLRGANSSVGVPGTPLHVVLKDGVLSGSAKAHCKKVAEASAYELRYRKEGEDNWILVPISFKRTIELPNIARPGTVVWIQMRALNTHGHSNWSDPATLMIR